MILCVKKTLMHIRCDVLEPNEFHSVFPSSVRYLKLSLKHPDWKNRKFQYRSNESMFITMDTIEVHISITSLDVVCFRYPFCITHQLYSTCQLMAVLSSRYFSYAWLITGFVTKAPLVEQELFILSQHLSSQRLLVGLVLLDL